MGANQGINGQVTEKMILSKLGRLAGGALLLILASPAMGSANTLVQQALDQSRLDLETALLYQVFTVRAPESLPAEYREPPGLPVCGTPTLSAVRDAGRQLSPGGQERLAKALARPVLGHDLLSPTGRFRVHYSLEGAGAVEDIDADSSGVPDYVDAVAAVLDSAWLFQVQGLGYQPPPSDRGRGGGDEYDVYLADLGGAGYYGFSYPEALGDLTASSYLELDNDYTNSVYRTTRGLDALRVTVAHEFFHAIHFGYYQGNDAAWWREVTSTWMEEVAYPDVDDYLQYVPHFLSRPERSLDSGSALSGGYHMYGAALFAHFLDQRFERSLIRAIWEEIGQKASASLEHFDRPLQQRIGRTLGETVSEFAVWNYFTGSRHQDGFYHEGDKYATQVPTAAINLVERVAAEDSGEVDHLGSAYLRLEPQMRPGGVELQTLELEGRWSRQLLLISPGSLGAEPANRDTVSLTGWDRHEEIVLILVSTELAGLGFGYRIAAEYDPALTDPITRVRQALGHVLPQGYSLDQNHPNPFNPVTTIDYALPRSEVVDLSIYDSGGQRVRRLVAWRQPAGRHRAVWDGRDDAGRQVASGLYYCELATSGCRASRKMTLIR